MPDYEKLEKLGEGNFGEVWLVYDKALDVRRAVKTVRPDRIINPTNFYDEPRTLMELEHPNIVKVVDAGKEKNGNLYIAMEYLKKRSLETEYRGKALPLSVALKYLCEICRGLEHAHINGFIHRDIKPANVLIGNRGEAKLSDFGLATRIPRGGVASPYGYLTHMAPEIIRDQGATVLTDIYAVGVTAYRLLNGDSFLPDVSSTEEIADLILDSEYPDRSHYRPYIPRQLRTIINRAMNLDPVKRFQCAASMRNSLEKILVCCDWKWFPRKNNVIYETLINGAKIKVVILAKANRRFDILTNKKGLTGCVRRITKDCPTDLTKAAMKRAIRQILSRYVTYGK